MNQQELSVLHQPDVIMTERPLNGGIQRLYRFTGNDYGASVVQHPYSYGGDRGLWELAVIVWNGENFGLCYDTPITDDVLGYLTEEEVIDTLVKIKALPAWKEETK